MGSWTDLVDQSPGQLALAVYNAAQADIMFLRDIPDPKLTNGTGGSVAEGYVGVQDTSTASKVVGTTVVGSSKRVLVAAEPIASTVNGRWRTVGQSLVNVTGTVNVGDELQTSATAGRAQAGTDNSFAIAITANPSGTGQIRALLIEQHRTPWQTLTPTVKTTASNVTYTATEVKGGLIARDPNGASRTDTLPSAANLVAALPGAIVGQGVPLLFRNDADASENLTLNAGTGGTLDPSTTLILARQDVVLLLLRLTNVGSGTEAYTVYPLTRYVAASSGGSGTPGSRLTLTTSGVVFFQDFAHIPDHALTSSADSWGWLVRTTYDAGTWKFVGGLLVNTSGTNFDRCSNMSVSQAAAVYEAKCFTPTAGSIQVGPSALVQVGADTMYSNHMNNGTRRLTTRVAGTETDNIDSADPVVLSNQPFVAKFKFSTSPHSKTVNNWLNRRQTTGPDFDWSASSGPTAAGGIGLLIYGGANAGAMSFGVYSSTVFSVAGLSGNQGFILYNSGGDEIGRSGVQSSGTASLDLALLADCTFLGYFKLFDDANSSYATPTAQGRFPAEGVATLHAGDQFTYA
jgi:hypothetical protein